MTKRSKRKKQARMKRAINYGIRDPRKGICTNCGEPGPHFAPPGLGSPGMYVCTKTA